MVIVASFSKIIVFKVKTQRKVWGFDENDMKTYSCRRGLRSQAFVSETACLSKYGRKWKKILMKLTFLACCICSFESQSWGNPYKWSMGWPIEVVQRVVYAWKWAKG